MRKLQARIKISVRCFETVGILWSSDIFRSEAVNQSDRAAKLPLSLHMSCTDGNWGGFKLEFPAVRRSMA